MLVYTRKGETMNRLIAIITFAGIGLWLVTGCGINQEVHKKVLKDRDTAIETSAKLQKEKEECQKSLKSTTEEKNADLVARSMQIDKLLKEKGTLDVEKQQLSDEQVKLSRQIQDLEKMRAAAEKRSADYQSLLGKLRKMIDAGTLEVKIRNGRMLVRMASDVVFPSAGTRIKAEAKEAIQNLAQNLKSFTGRKFLVVGHSDTTPIHTDRFPSNWYLSTQRAIEVIKVMIETGVPSEMLSAAGAAEFDPLTANEFPEGKATNRRVEIVFEPQIDELPGFDQVMTQKKP